MCVVWLEGMLVDNFSLSDVFLLLLYGIILHQEPD